MKELMESGFNNKVLVIGDGLQTSGIAICFAQGGFQVTVFTNRPETKERCREYLEDQNQRESPTILPQVNFTEVLPDGAEYFLAILSDSDEKTYHRKIISDLEDIGKGHLIIGVCVDYLPLSGYQKSAGYPSNLIGINWAEPADTTLFLELVENQTTNPEHTRLIKEMAIEYLDKDPYVIKNETGVRSRMLAALTREAFFLIEEGYAGIEDIDRACRNDAGTYSAFAGNFRYMDLMGTYAYGVVMKALNPELSDATHMPPFFTENVNQGKLGMKSGAGFYQYPDSSATDWNNKIKRYSREIRELMDKYPFGYLENRKVNGDENKAEKPDKINF